MEEEESWIGEVAERVEKKKRGEGLVIWVIVVVVVGWSSGRRRVWELVDGNLVKEKKKRGEGLMVVSEREGNITTERLDSIAENGTKELSSLLS